jgi:hypothetical protein
MTQNERNFGTKALRRDGAYGGTQGGGLYERALSETPGLAKLLVFSTAARLLAGLGRLLASDTFADAFCSAQTTLYLKSGKSARTTQKACRNGTRA